MVKPKDSPGFMPQSTAKLTDKWARSAKAVLTNTVVLGQLFLQATHYFTEQTRNLQRFNFSLPAIRDHSLIMGRGRVVILLRSPEKI